MTPALQRALLLFEQSRFDQAERELQQLLLDDPNHAIAHSLLARCLCRRKAFAEATREAEAGVHLAPNSSFAHYMHALVLNDRDRLPDAENAIGEAIRLDPEDADYWALFANLQMQQKAWSKALHSAEQGLAIDAEHVECNNRRAMALVKLGRKAEAGATIDATLARNPDDAFSHANQGWTLLEKGDHAKALEHFREALRIQPEMEWARTGLVEALKARYWLYGLILKYFLWMSKLSMRARWGVVLGGYFGYRVLHAVSQGNPVLAVWVLPFELIYAAFVLMTWLANPLFNLLLRFNRFGRLALSDDQRRSSTLVGVCLALSIVCFLANLASDNIAMFVAGWMFALLMLPFSAIHSCEVGWPRSAMIIYSALLAILAGIAVLGAALHRAFGLTAITALLAGIFLNNFVAAVLRSVRVND